MSAWRLTRLVVTYSSDHVESVRSRRTVAEGTGESLLQFPDIKGYSLYFLVNLAVPLVCGIVGPGPLLVQHYNLTL